MEGLGLTAVPSEVWESSEVTKVDLSRNSIQELPVELSSCVCLQVNIIVHGFFCLLTWRILFVCLFKFAC